MKVIVVPAIIILLFLGWFISSVTADSACNDSQAANEECAAKNSVLLPYISVQNEQTSETPTAAPTSEASPLPATATVAATGTAVATDALGATGTPIPATATPEASTEPGSVTPPATSAPTSASTAVPTSDPTAKPATATPTPRSGTPNPGTPNPGTPDPTALPSETPTSIVQQNQPPALSVVSPNTGQTFIVGELVVVDVSATDPDGSIDSVELFVDNSSSGIVQVAPYSWNVADLAAGTHQLRLVAIDDNGEETEITLTISIRDESMPALLSDPPIMAALAQEGNAISLSWSGCEAATSARVLYGPEDVRPSEMITTDQALVTANLTSAGTYRVIIECYDQLGNSVFSQPTSVEISAAGGSQ